MGSSLNVKCRKCGYSWNYQGKSEYYVTCPSCLRKVKIGDLPRGWLAR